MWIARRWFLCQLCVLRAIESDGKHRDRLEIIAGNKGEKWHGDRRTLGKWWKRTTSRRSRSRRCVSYNLINHHPLETLVGREGQETRHQRDQPKKYKLTVFRERAATFLSEDRSNTKKTERRFYSRFAAIERCALQVAYRWKTRVYSYEAEFSRLLSVE